MVFCVVVMAVLIGINLLINTSKDTDTAPKDELPSVTTTNHINADTSEENGLYTNPTTEPNITASNTVSLQNATKSTVIKSVTLNPSITP